MSLAVKKTVNTSNISKAHVICDSIGPTIWATSVQYIFSVQCAVYCILKKYPNSRPPHGRLLEPKRSERTPQMAKNVCSMLKKLQKIH